MEEKNNQSSFSPYVKFFVMIFTSMTAMFFLMYTHSYLILEHAWFSETRLFMTIIMGGAMVIIMLAFMQNQMYKDSKTNYFVYAIGVLMIAGAIWLVRSQSTVDDVDYMEGMIPHHSIAILTSERGGIKDPRVKELADKIIKAQRKEINEMEWLINDIRKNGIAKTKKEAAERSVPKF